MEEEQGAKSICAICHCRQAFPWADCDLPFPQHRRDEHIEKWFASAEAGVCSLCQLGAAVAKDAMSEFGFRVLSLSPTFDSHSENVIRLTLTLNCGSPGLMTSQVRIVILTREGKVGAEQIQDSTGHQLESYKPILNTNGTDTCIEQARAWLSSCCSSHRACQTAPRPMPTRILDLSVDPPRLQITDNESEAFVALSHCWGSTVDGEGPPLTTRNNIETHIKSIQPATIPRNFEDAISVTLALGFKYIWIDSLCIIQDDASDWAKEAASMKNVYENAALVLATSSSENVSRGILRERLSYKERTLEFDVCGLPGSGAITYREIPNHAGWQPTRQGPIDTRAWCFQERLMARRYLSFGSHEMLWECWDGSCCECGSKPTYYQASTRRQNNTPPFNIESLIKEGRQDMVFNTFSLYGSWCGIVWIYSRRQLTHQSDRLVALTAVADRFQQELGDQYLWGLWRRDFLYSLCWVAQGPGTIGAPSMPSWTWASISANISMQHVSSRDDTVDMAKILQYPAAQESHDQEATETPTVALQGPMVQALLVVDGGGHATLDIASPGSKEIAKTPGARLGIHLDVPIRNEEISHHRETQTSQRAHGDLQQPGEFPVHLVAIYGWRGAFSQWLILGRSVRDPDRFQRLGGGEILDRTNSFFTGWLMDRAVII